MRSAGWQRTGSVWNRDMPRAEDDVEREVVYQAQTR